jgi:HAD superfamily phosphatase (TIGR01668 family)
MRRLFREENTPYFVPDYVATSLTDVNFAELKKQGVRFLAFDADSTLLEYRGKQLSPEIIRFLAEQKRSFKGLCIASNRVTHDLEPIAASIGADLIQATYWARKPKRQFFRRVIEHFQARPHEIAMIGDKLVADMYGAKRMGLTTVWVERMGLRDSVWDRVLRVRRFEKRMMERYLRSKDVGRG